MSDLTVRVIPTLLLRDGGLVKTVRFSRPTYLGDPINAIKIFSEKEVDELAVIDIEATRKQAGPDLNLLKRINREAFMPLGYGGGVRDLAVVRKVLNLGFEKIIVDRCALDDPDFISRAADVCGSQSIVVCVDVKKDLFGRYRLYDYLKRRTLPIDPVEFARDMERRGAGELIINNVDREGTLAGYDLTLLKSITSRVAVPVVALGGAGRTEDLVAAVREGGASAVAAGSLFVFQGPRRAVLISYPERESLPQLQR